MGCVGMALGRAILRRGEPGAAHSRGWDLPGVHGLAKQSLSLEIPKWFSRPEKSDP